MAKTTFCVLTDTHYMSKRQWVEGRPITRREKGDQIAIKATPEIFRSFANKLIADPEIEYVLITGDLVNNGDKLSHEDFKKELERLTAAGKKVYVTTATHDYCGHNENGDENIFHATYYDKDETRPAERVSRPELEHLYDEYGPNDADSVDKSGSYSVKFGEGIRLIAINDNGNGRSHCGLFDDGFEWLEKEIDKAHANGEFVFLCTHHPVIPPWEIYRLVADFEMFGGYERLKKLMCAKNVPLIFTGHTHVQGIKKYVSPEGGYFYDVATSALPGAHGNMRKVTIDTDLKTVDIRSEFIDEIEGVDTNGLTPCEYVRRINFSGLLETLLKQSVTDWDAFLEYADVFFPADKLNRHPAAAKALFRAADKVSMLTVARIGGAHLPKNERIILKNKKVTKTVIEVMDHVFSGNMFYTPGTAEYKALSSVTKRADRILGLIKFDYNKIVKGMSSLTETAEPFFYNNRTGDDDSLNFSYKE